MNTTELAALFRAEVFDLAEPYLWSDALVYSYIDEAQKQFCRDTYGIADARSFKVNVLADGTEWYSIDPRILKIRSTTDSVTGLPVPLIPIEKMAAHNMKFDGTVGPLRAFITGMEDNVLRAWPKPNLASTVELRTFRLPEDVAAGDEFEIDPRHHRYLLHWVKALAYDVHDSEVFDPRAVEKNLGMHKAYCARVKTEQDRAMHPVGAVVYGGI
jgi:hypothetical protein